MKYIIIGRTCSGKTMLASVLARNGLSMLVTHTTRKRHGPEDSDHVFVTDQQADAIPDRILETRFSDRYFTTRSDVLKSDVMILEPEGAAELIRAFPETAFAIVHIQVPDGHKGTQMRKHVARWSDPKEAELEYEHRTANENRLFGEIESMGAQEYMKARKAKAAMFCSMSNDFRPESMQAMAGRILMDSRMHRNLCAITRHMLALEAIMPGKDPGTVLVSVNVEIGGKPGTIQMAQPIEQFTVGLMFDGEKRLYFLDAYLTHKLNISAPDELLPSPAGSVPVADGWK